MAPEKYPGRAKLNPSPRADPPGRSDTSCGVDRRLALKNIRTALIAGAVSLIVFALSWVVGLVY